MKWNEMEEISVEKWWNEICGRGKREKAREKPTQTPFRPPRNPHGGTETQTRDPNGGRRAPNRLRHEAAPQRSSWTWSVTNVKMILLKTRKSFSCRALSGWHCPYTRRKCFWPPPMLSPLYWTQREKYVGDILIYPLGTPFPSIHGSTHYLEMTNFNM